MEDKLKEAYASYCAFSKINGWEPEPYHIFKLKMDEMANRLTAEAVAGTITEPSDAHYLAISVKNAPIAATACTIDSCAQCGQDVWISVGFLERAKSSKGIICDDCAPEVFNKPLSALIARQLSRLK